MNGVIIVNRKYGNASIKIEKKIDRLIKEFNDLNVTIDVIINDGTLVTLKDNDIVCNIKDNDFIIYLDKDIYTVRCLEKAGYKVFSSSEFISLCDDKMLTNIEVSKMGINVPTTISFPLTFFNYEEEKEEKEFINKVINELSLPLVFKLSYGSLGEGVKLVHSFDEALKAYKEYKTSKAFFQKYIDASSSSIRVLVIDKKIITAIKRINSDDFRSNASNGLSTSSPYTMSEKMKDDVYKLIDKFNIGYAGIDFVLDKDDKYYFLEMNSNAFFFEAEKVSGFNIAKEYALYVLNNIA